MTTRKFQDTINPKIHNRLNIPIPWPRWIFGRKLMRQNQEKKRTCNDACKVEAGASNAFLNDDPPAAGPGGWGGPGMRWALMSSQSGSQLGRHRWHNWSRGWSWTSSHIWLLYFLKIIQRQTKAREKWGKQKISNAQKQGLRKIRYLLSSFNINQWKF